MLYYTCYYLFCRMAPLTNKEKMAHRREKLKADEHLLRVYRNKDKLRKAKKRVNDKVSMSVAEWSEYRSRENARIKARRHSKSATKDAANSTSDQSHARPYKSKQAMGKALKRVQSMLPNSPRKKKAVVAAIAKNIGFQFIQSVGSATVRQDQARESSMNVQNFYMRDDISWQAPGRKDHVIIRTKNDDGKVTKNYLQARYMLMSLSEAHRLYLDEYTESEKVGLSKFCELRPKQIKLFDSIPHNVCVCEYHENIRLILIALKEFTNLPGDLQQFTDKMVCEEFAKQCASRECVACKDNLNSFAPPEDREDLVKFYQWQTNDKTEKVEITCSLQEAFHTLEQQLRSFLIHVFVKRKQAERMKKVKEAVDGSKILLQVDFSENASLQSQNEIQSCHWSHGQATLFTAFAWIAQDITESIVIVSDDLLHNKLSVYAYITYILKYLTVKYKGIRQIDVFSDGASSQFKQRYLFSNLHLWEMEFDVELQWNFFATSHGKGVVDGLGGTVKRSVWRYVRNGSTNIASPVAFSEVAAHRNPNVHIKFISNVEILEPKCQLVIHWASTKPVPNTHGLHFVKACGDSHLVVGDTSDAIRKRVRIKMSDQPDDDNNTITVDQAVSSSIDTSSTVDPSHNTIELHISDWVVVVYDDEHFPGEITSVADDDSGDVRVNVMHKAGAYWKWPCTKDNILYKMENIIKKISPPVVAGTRGQFNFPDF